MLTPDVETLAEIEELQHFESVPIALARRPSNHSSHGETPARPVLRIV
jgi:hypothetical protein